VVEELTDVEPLDEAALREQIRGLLLPGDRLVPARREERLVGESGDRPAWSRVRFCVFT
jgi:hypothetical protein